MGYQIQYTNVGNPIDISTKRNMRWIKAAFVICVICLLILAYPPVRRAVSFAVFPGIDEDGIRSLEALANQIRQGVPLSEAVSAFCREIISNAS